MKNEPSMKALRELDLIPETKIIFFFNTIFKIEQRDGYLRAC